MPCQRLLIAGTDTDVGKTFVCAAIARLLVDSGVRLGVYKPVASGCDIAEQTSHESRSDPERLATAARLNIPSDRVCPQRFAAPLAPSLAAQAEGREVDEELMIEGAEWWSEQCDLLLIEGAGGLMSPISVSMTVADFATALETPVVLVAPNRLGVASHVLLACEALKHRRLELLAVYLNKLPSDAVHPSQESNAQLLRSFLPADTPVMEELSQLLSLLLARYADSSYPDPAAGEIGSGLGT